jgi:hypothetical protein
MLTISYIFFFSTWLLLTIFWQFEFIRSKSNFIRAINSVNFLPVWTFFAPRPGITDTHLLFRDKFDDNTISDWVEISVFESRKNYHFMWNPLKRYNKLIVDALSQVKKLKSIKDEEEMNDEDFQIQVRISKGYLILLSIVSKYKKINNKSMSRQFVIADTSYSSGQRIFTPIMSSPFHKL